MTAKTGGSNRRDLAFPSPSPPATLPLVKISLDVQSAVGHRAGVGRYTAHLAGQLAAAAPEDLLRLTYFDFQRHGEPFPADGVEWNPVRWCPGRLAQGLWKTLGAPAYDRFSGPADVFHFPNFIIPPLRRGRTVVTIHDMAFRRYPETVEDRNRQFLEAHIGNTARRADAVITVSAFSASEISHLLTIPPERISVVYHGISEAFRPLPPEDCRPALAALGIDRPYLLCVGTIEPRKNIPFLIELYERLRRFDGLLVLAGGAGWKHDPIFERIRQSPRAADIRWVRYVDDRQLPALYCGAELLIQPSHYEGFGFPPLEAMACGTPVLSSAGGSLAEVLDNAAVVLDTFDQDRWVESAERLLQDHALRADMTTRGQQHAAGFTWERAARETAAVYRKALA